MEYRVPFSSQYADLGHHEWRARGCGIAALKMVMDFWHAADGSNRTVALDGLLQAGLDAGAYREGIGWTHGGLAVLARRHGYEAFNADWAAKSPTPKTPEAAWAQLVRELNVGPVMASVYSRLDSERGGGHIVVVTGFADGLVAFNDPEEMSEREGRKLIALERFLPAFKLRYVVVRPKASA